MIRITHAARTAALGVAVLTFSAGLAACSPAAGTSAAPTAEPTIAKVDGAAALLPDAVKSAGVLKVAIPTNEPPTQFYRPGTQEMTGVNPDIARLIAQALGLKIQIQVTAFDAIIPGMAAGRYDLTVSSMTPTKARMELLDFVDYVQMGSALAVPAGNPKHISLDTLCGAKVAVLEGSYQLTVNIPPITDKCKADGKPAPQLFQFSDTHQAISSVLSDRTDVVYADQPILGYAAKQEPRIALAGISDIAPVSVGIAHDTGTLKAVSAALIAIVASPEYKKVLDKYGLTSMAITDPRVNAAQG